MIVAINDKLISKYFDGLVGSISDVSADAVKEVCVKGAEYARGLYETAKYDGEHDTEVSVQRLKNGGYAVVASGKSVEYIEYGTGLESIHPNSKLTPQWVFAAKGRTIRCTAGGKLLDNSVRAYYKGPRSNKRHYINLEYQKALGNVIEGENGELRIKSKADNVRRWKDPRTGKLRWKVVDESRKSFKIHTFNRRKPRKKDAHLKDQYYYTEGNPPNDVILKTRNYMRSISGDVLKEHLKKI